jgi:hypothetical protein
MRVVVVVAVIASGRAAASGHAAEDAEVAAIGSDTRSFAWPHIGYVARGQRYSRRGHIAR